MNLQIPAPHIPVAGKVTGEMQYHIEFPKAGAKINGAYIPVRGWVWHPRGIEDVQARTPSGTVPVKTRFGRPDIQTALLGHPHGYHTGFYMEISRRDWGPKTELWAMSRDGEWARFTTLTVSLHDQDFQEAQVRLMKALVCPTCFRRIEQIVPACEGCGRPIEWMEEVPSFLGPRPFPLARGEEVSRHPVLTEVVPEYFDLDGGGLFLDAGAGWPPSSRGNVLQLEIERFPSTNVVADGNNLPFADETFDGIISHAVMEHVRDPFGYSQDLMRTLKPGARILCHSAFLQPVHAYPDHFFNTTLEGLRELFKGLKIVEEGVAEFQEPWLAVEWILRSYCAGFTNEEEKKKFLGMKISDLLGDMEENRPMEQFRSLTEHTKLELAAGVYILGER